MKKNQILTRLLLAAVTCCMLFAFTACDGAPTGSAAPDSNEAEKTATLERYDYVLDTNGNVVDITIAQNLKSVKLEIKSMNLDITALCTVEGDTLTLTELAEGNEQFYKGLAAVPYTLNADGTATPAAEADKDEETTGLERYDYVADMSGNAVKLTISENLKSVKCAIESMGLEVTAFCTVEANTLTLTELVEGNEQVYNGLSATPYTLNADGTATAVE